MRTLGDDICLLHSSLNLVSPCLVRHNLSCVVSQYNILLRNLDLSVVLIFKLRLCADTNGDADIQGHSKDEDDPIPYRPGDNDCEEFSLHWAMLACQSHRMKIQAINDQHSELENFVVQGRQDVSNLKKKNKQIADGVRGFAVNEEALAFAVEWFPQTTLTCHYAKHGETTAVNLCLLWCSEMEYFYQYYLAFSQRRF